LAYFTIQEYIKASPHSDLSWEIDLSVYEIMMKPSLTWQGNIRELQMVCRRMLDLALAEMRQAGYDTLEILPKHVEAALSVITESA
jgi:transcriptional regulator with GAF, ATPase, and Fis domain